MSDASNLSSYQVPYWRLSSFYFFYFAVLGAWLPFLPLYLQSLDFDAKAIGYISGVMMATKVFAPSLWAWLADRLGQRIQIVRLGALASVFIFCTIFVEQTFWWLVVVIAGFSFFWNAILAPFEVITLQHLGKRYQRYSQIRVWGSIGFILLVVALGLLFDYVAITWLPWIVLLLLLGIVVSSFFVSESHAADNSVSRKESFFKVVKKPEVIAFIFICFLMQVSHGPYYTFFSVYLESHGYSRGITGLLWSLGVIAEVIVFIVMHKLLGHFSLKKIMLGSLLLGAVRWLLIAFFVDSMPILLVAQVLHAATFGSFHAFAVEVIRRVFNGGLEGHGMALYSGLSFGAGGAVGAVLSGYLWAVMPASTFIMAAACCFVAAIIGWFLRSNIYYKILP